VEEILPATIFGPATNRYFVWDGDTMVEERDGSNTVTKRFFAEGEQRVGGSIANYYYSRDHLGSIREVTASNGAVGGRYDYDAWGNVITTESKSVLMVDFGYTGHYFHQPSGLNLAMYRAYSPALGRWLSRDPLKNAEMSQGPNLYAYVGNNAVNLTDPLGLCPGDWWDPETLEDYLSRIGESLSDWYLSGDGYAQRYSDHLDAYLFNPGPYAVALFGGVWPKSLVPWTGGRIVPLGGPANPLTSVPSALQVPGARSVAARGAASGIGILTVAGGAWNVGVFGGGLIYAAFPTQ
jgi:RHS repeat-associated protein